MERNLECPKCKSQMDEGFIVDKSYGEIHVSEWAEGPPERGFWTGLKVKGVKRIATYRCSDCGYLESYAYDAEDKANWG